MQSGLGCKESEEQNGQVETKCYRVGRLGCG